MKILSNHTKAVRDVEWNQDGKKLLSCSYDKTAAVIDVEKGIVEILNIGIPKKANGMTNSGSALFARPGPEVIKLFFMPNSAEF